jgi:sterol desaturase/sphingolipid hydroxylase (fatty acid hydroxylase superfamily)
VKTLGEAWRGFWRNRSPWILAGALVAVAGLRIALGDPTWKDAVAVGLLLALYPFGEWAIHVYLLHSRPFNLGGREVELLSAREHRKHHMAPNRLDMVLLGPLELLALLGLAIPLTVWLGSLPIDALLYDVPFAALVSGALAGIVAVSLYEWCHYLIHTAYRPRGGTYRSIWRSHRLHHFKNERFWHGVTNNLSDRVLGTFPDQSEVPRSRTARTLRA